jgi:hypothetical protein
VATFVQVAAEESKKYLRNSHTYDIHFHTYVTSMSPPFATPTVLLHSILKTTSRTGVHITIFVSFIIINSFKNIIPVPQYVKF